MLRPAISLCLLLLNNLTLHGILPMRDQWRAASVALANGRAAEAAAAFEAFSTWYGEEPAAREPGFRESLLRLWAIAAIGSGQHAKALDLIGTWMEGRTTGDPFHGFFLFQQVRLHLALGQLQEVDASAARFLQEYPDLPERCLVRWYLARGAMLRQNTALARHHWQALLQDASLPDPGRELAQGAMALLELHEGQPLKAFEALSGTEKGTLLDAWRSFLAPAIAAQLLEGEHPSPALEATAWLDPTGPAPTLEDGSRGQLPTASTHPVRKAIWQSHWAHESGQLEALLKTAEPQLLRDYGLRLRALREAGRLKAARQLAEALIASRRILPAGLLAVAYREGIEALFAEEAWKTAQIWIDAFMETSPEDPALPAMHLMAARALAGQQDWRGALMGVEQLLGDWPAHPSAPNWAFLRAVWLLSDQQPARALEQLEALAASAPAAWKPLIDLQRAKGLNAIGQSETAIATLDGLTGNTGVPQAIRESAALEMLKLLLHTEGEAFGVALLHYRTHFQDGQLAPMVEMLAGTYHLAHGQWEEARIIWQKVAALPVREAGYARQQLLTLLPQHHLWEALKREGTHWLRIDWHRAPQVSFEGLEAVRLYQEKTSDPALPGGLLLDLFEGLRSGQRGIPPLLFFDLLAGAWPAYAETMGAPQVPFSTWIEHLASPLNADPRIRAIARLHRAEHLDREGRTDSADALRIAVLQDETGQPAEPGPAFVLARTAHRYDFPDAAARLSTFIVRFKSHRRYPDSLFLLAARHMREARPETAIPLLESICTDWPDHGLASDSALRLADLHLQANDPAKAHARLEGLLKDPRPDPLIVAQALERRIQADLMLDNLEKALLTGLRLLSIYPGYAEICSRTMDHITAATEGKSLDPEIAAIKEAIHNLFHAPA